MRFSCTSPENCLHCVSLLCLCVEMQSALHCLRVVVVLLSLAPSTQSFSHGASHASCQEMIPGHIRAQSLDPQQSYVTLHTSASSYLSGQLVTGSGQLVFNQFTS